MRIANQPYPLFEFDVPYEYLSPADVQTMEAFNEARISAWDSFLFKDPSDYSTIKNALNAGSASPWTGLNVIGVGDGGTLTFQLTRSIGGVARPVYDINGITASSSPPSPPAHVYVNSVEVLPAGGVWSITSAGVLTFGAGRAPGAYNIAVDFEYFWRVRFADDTLEIGNFGQDFFECKKVSLKQVWL